MTAAVAPDDRTVVHTIELIGATVRFGGVTALNNIDFAIDPGEVRGLIGPNGAGKTTLLDLVSGFHVPQSGEVRMFGEQVTETSTTTRARRGLRRTFQRQQLFGSLSVEDNVLAGLEWRQGGGGMVADLVAWPRRSGLEDSRREQARAVISLCGLDALRDVPAAQLPIGRARMVEVARALVDNPTVVLLDEPTSGLDEAELDRLGSVMAHIRLEQRAAVVLVEHDVNFVMSQSTCVTVLERGSIIAEGSPDEIRSSEIVRTAYFG